MELCLEVHKAHGTRVRHFAKYKGLNAKNDPIDARLLALFGLQTENLVRYQPPSAAAQALRALQSGAMTSSPCCKPSTIGSKSRAGRASSPTQKSKSSRCGARTIRPSVLANCLEPSRRHQGGFLRRECDAWSRRRPPSPLCLAPRPDCQGDTLRTRICYGQRSRTEIAGLTAIDTRMDLLYCFRLTEDFVPWPSQTKPDCSPMQRP